jgi:ABC-type lipoprotein export system ATPase subunit
VLTLSAISKSYPTPAGPLRVLADVSVTLATGEAAVITGPSGSGKSTLLYIAGGLEAPSAGTVDLDGTNPYTLGAESLARFRNREVGFIFQDHCLLPQLTVLENVLVPTLVGDTDGDARDRAHVLLGAVGLEPRVHHRPSQLSGGEKQRAAIARALIEQPEILLADEPTGNVDPPLARRLLRLFIELNRLGTAVVIATHDLGLMEQVDARRMILNGGRLEIHD